jgi:hypothetical protein
MKTNLDNVGEEPTMRKRNTRAAISAIALAVAVTGASAVHALVAVAMPPSAFTLSQQGPPPPPPPDQASQTTPPRAPKVEKPVATPAPAPQPAPTPAPPRAPGQLINVRVDVTVTDQLAGRAPVTRTLSVTAADGESANVRSNLEIPAGARILPTGFSLDAMPRIVDGGRVRLALSLDFNSTDAGTEGSPRSSSNIRVRQEVILENGKPLVIAQPVDAMTDRKVTVEARATILK